MVSTEWGEPKALLPGFNPADVQAGKYGRRYWLLCAVLCCACACVSLVRAHRNHAGLATFECVLYPLIVLCACVCGCVGACVRACASIYLTLLFCAAFTSGTGRNECKFNPSTLVRPASFRWYVEKKRKFKINKKHLIWVQQLYPFCLLCACILFCFFYLFIMTFWPSAHRRNMLQRAHVLAWLTSVFQECRFLHNPDSVHGFVGAALSSTVIHFYKDTPTSAKWKADPVVNSWIEQTNKKPQLSKPTKCWFGHM